MSTPFSDGIQNKLRQCRRLMPFEKLSLNEINWLENSYYFQKTEIYLYIFKKWEWKMYNPTYGNWSRMEISCYLAIQAILFPCLLLCMFVASWISSYSDHETQCVPILTKKHFRSSMAYEYICCLRIWSFRQNMRLFILHCQQTKWYH